MAGLKNGGREASALERAAAPGCEAIPPSDGQNDEFSATFVLLEPDRGDPENAGHLGDDDAENVGQRCPFGDQARHARKRHLVVQQPYTVVATLRRRRRVGGGTPTSLGDSCRHG